MHAIIESNDYELVQSVLRLIPADVAGQALRATTFNGNTSLHIAAQMPIKRTNQAIYSRQYEQDIEQRKRLIQLLIAHGADVSAKNMQGELPMHVVANHEKQVWIFPT